VIVLSGFIKFVPASCQVCLQRVLVVGQLIKLTLEILVSLLRLALLIFERLDLIVAYIDILQQRLNLRTAHASPH